MADLPLWRLWGVPFGARPRPRRAHL